MSTIRLLTLTLLCWQLCGCGSSEPAPNENEAVESDTPGGGEGSREDEGIGGATVSYPEDGEVLMVVVEDQGFGSATYHGSVSDDHTVITGFTLDSPEGDIEIVLEDNRVTSNTIGDTVLVIEYNEDGTYDYAITTAGQAGYSAENVVYSFDAFSARRRVAGVEELDILLCIGTEAQRAAATSCGIENPPATIPLGEALIEEDDFFSAASVFCTLSLVAQKRMRQIWGGCEALVPEPGPFDGEEEEEEAERIRARCDKRVNPIRNVFNSAFAIYRPLMASMADVLKNSMRFEFDDMTCGEDVPADVDQEPDVADGAADDNCVPPSGNLGDIRPCVNPQACPLTDAYEVPIKNGDAESSAGSPTFGGALYPPDSWDTAGTNFTVMTYAANDGNDVGLEVSTRIGGGSNYFAGGPSNGQSSAIQMVSLVEVGSALDSGAVRATLSAALGGWEFQDDHIQVTARWFDDDMVELGDPLDLDPVKSSDRIMISEQDARSDLIPRTNSMLVPAGTRAVEITLLALKSGGIYNDGYADNITMVLDCP